MATPSPAIATTGSQPGISTRVALASVLAQPNTAVARSRTISAPDDHTTPLSVIVSSPATGPRYAGAAWADLAGSQRASVTASPPRAFWTPLTSRAWFQQRMVPVCPAFIPAGPADSAGGAMASSGLPTLKDLWF